MTFFRTTLLVALVGLLVTGCDFFEQRDRSFTGDPQIEFFPLDETVDEGDRSVTVEVQLIGRQRDSELPVSFQVDDDASSAVSGTHYQLNATSSAIPANESETSFTIDVLDNNVDDDGTNYELVLVLQDSDGVEAAENLKTYTLTIRGEDETP